MAYKSMRDTLDELASHGMKVFRVSDAAKVMGKSSAYASKLLSSNKQAERIERGVYYIKGTMPSMYEISSQIVFPSYVSCFAAMQFHGLAEQSVIAYTVITIKRHKPIELMGSKIEFVTVARNRFFGYRKYGSAYVATAEKTIVDSLYLRTPPLPYVSEALEKALRSKLITAKTLMRFASKMGSKKVMAQISVLLKANAADLKM
jgi:predicted transcriptional regulator of viral defense system